MWLGLSQRIEDFLQNITLAELVAKDDVLEVTKRQDDLQAGEKITASAETLIKTRKLQKIDMYWIAT